MSNREPNTAEDYGLIFLAAVPFSFLIFRPINSAGLAIFAVIRSGFWHADCLDAGMSNEDYTLVLLQIVCLLMFSCGFVVLTHHPEWFGA